MKRIDLPHHMRIAALQCNFEKGRSGTMRVATLWKRMGFNTEQLFHTHSELYSAVFDRRRHGPLLRRYLAKARKNGLSIILYMNCHILLTSQDRMARRWAQVRKDGGYEASYGTYKACCLNSSWVDFFLKSISSLRDLDIAGIFFDGPTSGPCYCQRCRKQFRRSHGASLLNAPPSRVSEFVTRSQVAFMRKAYEAVKQVNPHWIAYYNLPLMHAGMPASGVQELLQYNDIIGTEGGFQFYGPPKDVDIWRCGQNAKLVESVAGEKRKVIFMAGDHKPWSWYLHTPTETRLCYASALANGSSVWYGIHCSTRYLKSAAGAAAGGMVRFDRQQDALYRSTRSCSSVALFFSFDTNHRHTMSGEETDFYRSAGSKTAKPPGDYRQAFLGTYGALFRSGIPFDIVTELGLDRLAGYDVLVLPAGACMSEAAAGQIRQFVSRGGTLIADAETSLYTEAGSRRTDFLLSDLLGLSFRGSLTYQNHDYFALDGAFSLFANEGVLHIPAPIRALEVRPAPSAQILARLCPPIPGRYAGHPRKPIHPFLIRNNFGRGHSYYLAGAFFELYRKYGIPHYRKLLETLVLAHSAPPAMLVSGQDSVEITVRETMPGRRLLIHLVNYTGGMTRPIDRITPLRDVAIRLKDPILAARAMVADRQLRVERKGRIILPVLNEFEVILTG